MITAIIFLTTACDLWLKMFIRMETILMLELFLFNEIDFNDFAL